VKSRHWILLGLVTASAIAGELFGPHDAEHAAHWWSGIPLFYLLFGFLGCVVISYFSKRLGKYLLQRKEDYYGPQ
jgi:TM2 domain-containing membrane protein YozV